MEMLNPFDSIDQMEPKCPTCQIRIEFDITTRYDEVLESVVCNACGHSL